MRNPACADRGALYRPEFEKASCGFGLIAQMDNQASHWLVQTAITSLTRLAHRGAIAPDGKTGDGCGLLFRIPDQFFRALAEADGVTLPAMFAVGALFLNPDKLLASNALSRLKKELREQGLECVWERPVPVEPDACGEQALKTLPQFVQIFVAPSAALAPTLDEPAFDRLLYIARRRAKKAITPKDSVFYVTSLSCRTVSYKGMVMPANLPVFYPDLRDERFVSSLCLYHQRFSTNTFPEWRLAQPFRMLAHNGEINTVSGNRNWAVSRETKYDSPLIPDMTSLLPLVSVDGSDSMSLDNMLEALVVGGMDLFLATRVLAPPAWQNMEAMDPDLRSLYSYYSLHMDPWDGPAGLVITDGRYAACAMDRNGLRPARYVITRDRHITIASEIGVYDYAPSDVLAKGRLRPGEMMAVDMTTGELLLPEDVNTRLKNRNPYKQWLDEYVRVLEPNFEEEEPGCDPIFDHEWQVYQKQFLLTLEERSEVLRPLGETGQETVASMGDDTPTPVLSRQIRPLYEYFRQQFAQVTNPPIDPIREQMVMSLRTILGRERNPFAEVAENAARIDIRSPILSRSMFRAVLQLDDPHYAYETIDLTYPTSGSLRAAIETVCDQAERAVRNGKVILILTDRRVSRNRIPIHALLGVGAVHARLCEKGLRCDANIIVETATARDPHHFAALIGFGATAIYPYLAYQTLYHMAQRKEIQWKNTVGLMKNYRQGIQKGLYKILSKMGISTINSYRGARLFEAIGLHDEVIDLCFPGVVSRLQGANFDDLEAEQRQLAKEAWSLGAPIRAGGLIKYRPGSEYHAFNPDVVMALQRAVRTEEPEDYRRFADLVNRRPPMSLRDLLTLRGDQTPIPLDEVEPAEAIFPRFNTAAMSLGSLSPEAHESLAIAMNRLGGMSNSGEGGEDDTRFGTEKVSKIKQVASGRFGVTPAYLVNADVLQIKIAQGAKPGEGGQLPGHKVNELIARLRYTLPGTPLISPPPHHDIYSIEDLAQLIFDLKQVNPRAMVSVKLVAEPGVGTIAAGVAKTYADLITISGYDGGTGASPLTSVRYAGVPWELGVAEAHQILQANDLRDKVRLQVDGGLKTGLDVVKAALLGAESFGFGTAPLISLGCKFLRICHLNNCATGVATQNPVLRGRHFKGLPEMVEAYFRFVAQEIRELMAQLGAHQLEDLVGRRDLLMRLPGETERQRRLDLSPLLTIPRDLEGRPRHCMVACNPPFDKAELAEQMVCDARDALERKTGGEFFYEINNTHRSIGARLSGEIARRHGNAGMQDAPVTVRMRGTAGQSFGAWNAGGLNLILEGDANDYVGKGMAGGKIVVYPPEGSAFKSQQTPIIGNTCLYGATGGKLFAAGQAGERFCVRNSGALAIVEGVGDHGCEYMTGGVVVVLGQTGYNFGAGMTGGFAYVYDAENEFVDCYNHGLVDIHRIDTEHMDDYATHLQSLIREFVAETRSAWGRELLDHFYRLLGQFWLVKPKAAELETLLGLMRIAA
ncbi:MAG: glutamate synthase large subunit [Vampirovibrionales bacterium]|nr:glutamate synthase large subunit [Vampirovibrionales bacterium]